MKSLLIKTLKIFPLILGGFGLILPAAMSQTHFAIADELSSPTPEVLTEKDPTNIMLSTPEVDPSANQLLQQIQRLRQPKGFQVTNNDLSQVTDVNQLRDVEPTAWCTKLSKVWWNAMAVLWAIPIAPLGEIERYLVGNLRRA